MCKCARVRAYLSVCVDSPIALIRREPRCVVIDKQRSQNQPTIGVGHIQLVVVRNIWVILMMIYDL